MSSTRVPPPAVGMRAPPAGAASASPYSAGPRWSTSAPAAVSRIDALAWRLMNRSARLLLAMAARSSSVTVASPERVRTTRSPSRRWMAACSRNATPRVTSFSSVPSGPCVPASAPPCPGSMATARTVAGGARSARTGSAASAAAPPAGLGSGAGGGAARAVAAARRSMTTSRLPPSAGVLAASKPSKAAPSCTARRARPSSTVTRRSRSSGGDSRGTRSRASASKATSSRSAACSMRGSLLGVTMRRRRAPPPVR